MQLALDNIGVNDKGKLYNGKFVDYVLRLLNLQEPSGYVANLKQGDEITKESMIKFERGFDEEAKLD